MHNHHIKSRHIVHWSTKCHHATVQVCFFIQMLQYVTAKLSLGVENSKDVPGALDLMHLLQSWRLQLFTVVCSLGRSHQPTFFYQQ